MPLADLHPGAGGFLLLRQHAASGHALLPGPHKARLPSGLSPARWARIRPAGELIDHDIDGCPLCCRLRTQVGHRARSEKCQNRTPNQPYSIPAAAPATSPAGTSSPSSLADFRLMTNSKLFSSGMSAGLAPRKRISAICSAFLRIAALIS